MQGKLKQVEEKKKPEKQRYLKLKTVKMGGKVGIASWRYRNHIQSQAFLFVQNCTEIPSTLPKFQLHLCPLNYITAKKFSFFNNRFKFTKYFEITYFIFYLVESVFLKSSLKAYKKS